MSLLLPNPASSPPPSILAFTTGVPSLHKAVRKISTGMNHWAWPTTCPKGEEIRSVERVQSHMPSRTRQYEKMNVHSGEKFSVALRFVLDKDGVNEYPTKAVIVMLE